MDFGVTVLPDPPFSRWLELIQLAERHGFGYAWTYDSHVLWQESVPMLAVAGSLVQKKIVPVSAGTFPTDSPLFVGLVVGVIAITGGLIYFPAVSLGPIVEHFSMHAGTLFDTGS